jgi:hypothetical protein
VIHLACDVQDKTSVLPNLDLVVGHELAKRCVRLGTGHCLKLHISGGRLVDSCVHVLHVSCVRFSRGAAPTWRNNFTFGAIFPVV